MSRLILDHLTFQRRDTRLLDDISLRMQAGQRTILLGPNGAGKTLLLRLCHGLLQPTSGTIHWTGRHPRQAMVFQRPVLLRRSALANLMYALRLNRVPRHQRERLAHEALAKVGLAHRADHPARLLSGGEQQRLALARCHLLAPDVLFLDEPTASLDPYSTAAIETAVQRFHTTGTQIVMSTHDLGQARRLADDVIFLHDGRLQEHSPAERFFTAPETETARRFVAGELVVS